MALNAAKSQLYKSLERFFESLSRSVVVLAGSVTRIILLVLGTIFLFWQLYFFAWQPLRSQSELPEGVRGSMAELDLAGLQAVQEARAARLQHAPNLFSGGDRYFAVPAPVPTVSLPSPSVSP